MSTVSNAKLLVVFENNDRDNYKKAHKIISECIFKNKFLSIYSFRANARAWKTITATNRFIDLQVPSLNAGVHEAGKIIVFLNENEKHVSLPFIYYQLRRALSIQASYEVGRVFINIVGPFILNVNCDFSFKVVVIEPEIPVKYREYEWEEYDAIKKIFGIKSKG